MDTKRLTKNKSSQNILAPHINATNTSKERLSIRLGLGTADIRGKEIDKTHYRSEVSYKVKKENSMEVSKIINKTLNGIVQDGLSEIHTSRSIEKKINKRIKSQSKFDIKLKSHNDGNGTKRIKDLKKEAEAEYQRKQEELGKNKRNAKKNDLLRNKLNRKLDQLLDIHNPLKLNITFPIFCNNSLLE